MNSELWGKVKVGDWVILANIYDGVIKAEVVEVDVKVAEPLPTFHYDYPWGMTAESGVVKLKYDETEKIENLADLVRYKPAYYTELKKAFDEWQQYKGYEESYKAVFTNLVAERKAE